MKRWTTGHGGMEGGFHREDWVGASASRERTKKGGGREESRG